MFKVLIILLFIFPDLVSAGDWKLKKSGTNYKAYIKAGENKSYRITADFRVSADKIVSFLTDFKSFPEIYDGIESVDIIENDDSTSVNYTVLKVPWPFTRRDMVTKVRVKKKDGNTKEIHSESVSGFVKERSDRIRIKIFEETVEIDSVTPVTSGMIITGTIETGDMVPGWLEDRLLFSGPVKTVELISKLKEKE